MLFRKQIEFVDSLESFIYSQLQDVVRSNGFVLENYVIEKQLFDKGIDGNEKRLRGYTRFTIRIKLSKGQPVDRTTLRDTKSFHDSITVKGMPTAIEISSNVPYDHKLVERYGKDILRPTLDNMKDFFNQYFLPQLKKAINDQITG